MRHIALSHTPFHLLQLGILAEEIQAKGERLIVFHEGRADISVPGIDQAEIVSLPGYTGYRDGRRIARENTRRILGHPAWRGAPYTFYASDLKWLTNNAVYSTLPARQRASETILFTDGLGSYLERKDLLRTVVTAIAKSALGIARIGPQHRPFLRNHFGLDSRYVAAVTGFRADLIVGDVPKRPLRSPTGVSQRDPVPDISMVLGAPLDPHRFSSGQANQVINGTINATKATRPRAARLLYKPHHFEHASIAGIYAAAGFEIVHDTRPAELVVRDLGVTAVFGAYSSALAFAPIYHPTCRAYSVCFDAFADGYLNRADRERLRSLLSAFGVAFV